MTEPTTAWVVHNGTGGIIRHVWVGVDAAKSAAAQAEELNAVGAGFSLAWVATEAPATGLTSEDVMDHA